MESISFGCYEAEHCFWRFLWGVEQLFEAIKNEYSGVWKVFHTAARWNSFTAWRSTFFLLPSLWRFHHFFLAWVVSFKLYVLGLDVVQWLTSTGPAFRWFVRVFSATSLVRTVMQRWGVSRSWASKKKIFLNEMILLCLSFGKMISFSRFFFSFVWSLKAQKSTSQIVNWVILS